MDQNVINGLIIGGIVKIIAGHDAIKKELDTKIDKLEKESITSKCRIESLETWINKQDETLKKMRDENEARRTDVDLRMIRMHHLNRKLRRLATCAK